MNKKTLFDWYVLEANKYFAYFGWTTSSIFSFIGVVAQPHLPWWMLIIAGVFAIGVNVVEAGMGQVSLSELRHPKDINGIVTTLFGFFAYVYDIWTNIAGFCFMFAGTAQVFVAWQTDKTQLVWPVIFGILFAIGPEPLYRFYMTHTFAKPKKVSQSSYSTTYTPTSYQPKYKPTSQAPQTGMRSLGGKSPAEYLRELQEKRDSEGK